MDYPVTIIVEADSVEDAEEKADFRALDEAFDKVAGPLGGSVGFRYDDIDVGIEE